jgi:hypothetical protein
VTQDVTTKAEHQKNRHRGEKNIMINMDKMVEVKELNIIGTVHDFNEKYIWIENDEDIFVVKADKVTQFVEAAAEPEFDNDFERAMSENGIEFDGYTDGDNVSYMIEGFTYSINAYLDFESGVYTLDTLHKGKDEDSREWANRKEYKKLSTLIKNTLKWTDK